MHRTVSIIVMHHRYLPEMIQKVSLCNHRIFNSVTYMNEYLIRLLSRASLSLIMGMGIYLHQFRPEFLATIPSIDASLLLLARLLDTICKEGHLCTVEISLVSF